MIEIWGKTLCPHCDQAKALMKGAGINYVEYNIQSPSSKWVLYLLKRSSITTVPQIFNTNGTHIGGYTDLKEYLEHDNANS